MYDSNVFLDTAVVESQIMLGDPMMAQNLTVYSMDMGNMMIRMAISPRGIPSIQEQVGMANNCKFPLNALTRNLYF